MCDGAGSAFKEDLKMKTKRIKLPNGTVVRARALKTAIKTITLDGKEMKCRELEKNEVLCCGDIFYKKANCTFETSCIGDFVGSDVGLYFRPVILKNKPKKRPKAKVKSVKTWAYIRGGCFAIRRHKSELGETCPKEFTFRGTFTYIPKRVRRKGKK